MPSSLPIGFRGSYCEAHLGTQTSCSSPEQVVPVRKVDGSRHLFQKLDNLGGRLREALGNDGRVDTLAEELLCSSEEGTGEDDDGRCSVSSLNVLSSRQVDELCTQCTSDPFGAVSPRVWDRRTMRAAGCMTLMCLRMVAPSFVMTTSPCAV